jgi:hypothetical protein
METRKKVVMSASQNIEREGYFDMEFYTGRKGSRAAIKDSMKGLMGMMRLLVLKYVDY